MDRKIHLPLCLLKIPYGSITLQSLLTVLFTVVVSRGKAILLIDVPSIGEPSSQLL